MASNDCNMQRVLTGLIIFVVFGDILLSVSNVTYHNGINYTKKNNKDLISEIQLAFNFISACHLVNVSTCLTLEDGIDSLSRNVGN